MTIMKNFRQFLNSQTTAVYHVSPNSSIGVLKPTGSHKGQQSVKMNQGGIYVAPKFKDAVAWAVSYVGGKKYNTQKPNERLKEKESGGGRHGEKGPRSYKELTIYKIEIPKELLKNVWSSSFWEPEYFIPSEHMSQLKIIKSETYSLSELQVLHARIGNKKFEVKGSDNKSIEKASKTNLAARYYLELTDLYNKKLLSGKKPIIRTPDFSSQNDHLIHQKIQELKKYIITSGNNWSTIKIIDRLSPQEIKEVEQIYNNIKNLIENL